MTLPSSSYPLLRASAEKLIFQNRLGKYRHSQNLFLFYHSSAGIILKLGPHSREKFFVWSYEKKLDLYTAYWRYTRKISDPNANIFATEAREISFNLDHPSRPLLAVPYGLNAHFLKADGVGVHAKAPAAKGSLFLSTKSVAVDSIYQGLVNFSIRDPQGNKTVDVHSNSSQGYLRFVSNSKVNVDYGGMVGSKTKVQIKKCVDVPNAMDKALNALPNPFNLKILDKQVMHLELNNANINYKFSNQGGGCNVVNACIGEKNFLLRQLDILNRCRILKKVQNQNLWSKFTFVGLLPLCVLFEKLNTRCFTKYSLAFNVRNRQFDLTNNRIKDKYMSFTIPK